MNNPLEGSFTDEFSNQSADLLFDIELYNKLLNDPTLQEDLASGLVTEVDCHNGVAVVGGIKGQYRLVAGQVVFFED